MLVKIAGVWLYQKSARNYKIKHIINQIECTHKYPRNIKHCKLASQPANIYMTTEVSIDVEMKFKFVSKERLKNQDK